MEGRRAAEDKTVSRRVPGGGGVGAAYADLPLPEERGPAAYVAEFIGTFGLVLFITVTVVLFAPAPGEVPQGAPPGTTPEVPFQDWAVIGLVHVFVLFMLIQTLAIISGAHFNPAVTVALMAIRQIRAIDGAIYIVVQLAGATLAALVTKTILSDEGEALNHGAVALSKRIEESSFPAGFCIEALGTFFLVWAIVGVAVNPRAVKDWAAFTIGGTLGFAVMAFGPLTGGGFNPARAFGPAIVSKAFDGAGDFIVAYVAGPIVGALLAAGIYFYLFILPGKKGPLGMEPVG